MSDELDVIVVGSGAAGGWAAKVLTEGGLRVGLIEAGRALDDARDFPIPPLRAGGMMSRVYAGARGQHLQARCTSFSPKTAHFYVNDRQNPYTTDAGAPFAWFRGRQLGGRLHTWGRVALRMSDAELRPTHDLAADAAWPISYAELAPYYDEVERTLGVLGQPAGIANLPDGVFAAEQALSPSERAFVARVEAEVPGVRAIQSRIVAHNPARTPIPIQHAARTGRLTLRTNTVVSHLVVDPNSGVARGVAVIDRLTKRASEISARAVVLCASTIETLRILLHSRSPRHPDGVGASSGLLGRYLCDHMLYGIGGRLGGDAGELFDDRPADPYDFAVSGLYLPSTSSVTDGYLGGYGIQCAIGRRTPAWWMLAFGQMLPRYENCVTLHRAKRDAWGIPVPHIRCVRGDNEQRMLAHMKARLRELAAAGGLPLEEGGGLGVLDRVLFKVLRSRVLAEDGSFIPGAAIHETGGARMGDDPQRSVVDSQNRVWDARNVLVTDGACFPAAGFQNHTLTIMALTVRACKALLRERVG